MKKEEPKLMTAKEFATAINRPYPTVAMWLRDGLIPEATFLQLGGMRVWQIPSTIISTFEHPKVGRPKGSKTKTGAEKPTKKSRSRKKRTEK